MAGTERIFLNARRNGYDYDQCGKTMTVRELIEYLEQFDDATEVFLKHDNGYTYGSIRELDFEEVETPDEIEPDYYEEVD